MNKKMLAGLTIIVLIAAIGGNVYAYNRYEKLSSLLEEEKTSYPEVYDTLDSITYKTFAGKVENQEDFIVYVGRPTCSDCTYFEPEFISMIEELGLEQKIYYLNVAKIRENEDEWEHFKEIYGIQYTPSIVKIEKGKTIDIIGWTPEEGIDIDEIREYLENI